jgi:hypothetical protein
VPFLDFQLRAWQADAGHVHVLVHSSPVGGMRTPVVVPFDPGRVDAMHEVADVQWFGEPGTRRRVEELGRDLAAILLPREVVALLIRSLERLVPSDGLRLRLCLDEVLVDLPWEYLALPGDPGQEVLAGFLVQHRRLSVVREPPTPSPPALPTRDRQRMLYAATFGPGADDPWGLRDQQARLAKALKEVSAFLAMDGCTAADDNLERQLRVPTAIFHYYGHTDVHDTRSYLVRSLHTPAQARLPRFEEVDPLYSERLADLLRGARTRLAVFAACNSGRWPFVKPLLAAGLQALVGVQGRVSVVAATAFCARLYAALAIGLSLDEAILSARLEVLDAGVSPTQESCEWGAFMVYMPVADAVLFPRPAEDPDVHGPQEGVRQDTRRRADNHALRQAIVGAFSGQELEILCADVQQDLRDAGKPLDGPLELAGGQKEYRVFRLMQYLDRRGYLGYLEQAVRRARPALSW